MRRTPLHLWRLEIPFVGLLSLCAGGQDKRSVAPGASAREARTDPVLRRARTTLRREPYEATRRRATVGFMPSILPKPAKKSPGVGFNLADRFEGQILRHTFEIGRCFGSSQHEMGCRP